MTQMLQEGRFRAGLDVYEASVALKSTHLQGLEGEELPAEHPLRSVPESIWVQTSTFLLHESSACNTTLKKLTFEII